MNAPLDRLRDARVEQAILACYERDYEPDPCEIAEVLVDEDVAAGLYEGCSSNLEAWFSEFERIAEQMLTLRTRADARRRLDDLGRQRAAHNQRRARSCARIVWRGSN